MLSVIKTTAKRQSVTYPAAMGNTIIGTKPKKVKKEQSACV